MNGGKRVAGSGLRTVVTCSMSSDGPEKYNEAAVHNVRGIRSSYALQLELYCQIMKAMSNLSRGREQPDAGTSP